MNDDEVSFPRISFLGKMTGTSSGCFIYLYSSLVFPEFFFFFFNFFILLIILFLCQGPLHSSKLSNTFLPIIYIKKYKHTYIYIYIYICVTFALEKSLHLLKEFIKLVIISKNIKNTLYLIR